jgi:integrase/recombinase XerD
LVGFKPRTFYQWRLHVAVLVALDAGLRQAEILNLHRADVDFDNLLLRVMGKGRKERLVPFSPELRRWLYRFDQFRAKKGWRYERLFTSPVGVRWEKRNSTTSLHLLLDHLGLPKFGWLRLRHTFATNYLRQGGDIVRLSMVLGHSQITTTQRYLHLVTGDLSVGHQRVSILNRLG